MINPGQNFGLLLMMVRAEIVTQLLQSHALWQLKHLVEPGVATRLTKPRV